MTRLAKNITFLMMAGGAMFGQGVSVGVIGGVRATGDFEYAAKSESRRYVVGPAVAVGLPLGFGIEFDALYRRQGYRTGNSTPLYSSSIREADNVWEFPVLATYRMRFPVVHPSVKAGWAPRVIRGNRNTDSSYLSQLNPPVYTYGSVREHVSWPVTHGLVVGGGVQFGVGRLQLAPEVRYTRWNKQAIYGYFGDGPSYGSSRNQVDFLLGIRWRMTK